MSARNRISKSSKSKKRINDKTLDFESILEVAAEFDETSLEPTSGSKPVAETKPPIAKVEVEPLVDAEVPPEMDKRVLATKEDYLAVQLHQARTIANDFRNAVVKKDHVIIKLLARITELEIASVDRDNVELRKSQGFVLGRSITVDDDTGEIWWEPANTPIA